MGTSYILLSCLFVILETAQADLTEIPEVVKFSVLSEENKEITVNLLPTKTYLASENVPIWIPKPSNPTELTQVTGIMEKLTPFTVYWDRSNCAAALFYHDRNQFVGSIGHHHIIWKLKYNPTTKKVEPTDRTVLVSPLEKHYENKFDGGEKVIKKKDGNTMPKWKKSLQKYPETVYVETLVMVDYGITQELQFDYISIVSYVLSLFNSVDMIFSKIEIPNIKINIAGIIIATTRKSFPQLQKKSCYEKSPLDGTTIVMNGVCVNKAVKVTLEKYQKLSSQSYDIVIFLTRYPLVYEHSVDSKREKIPIMGVATSPKHNNGYILSENDRRVASVGSADIFEFLPTAAHEIAHLLGVPHDEGPLRTKDGTCDAHLMKKDSSYCRKCFKFGGTTQKYLEKFFGSRDACIFHNKPRSLSKNLGPRLFWSEDDQCKCYGYTAAYKSRNIIYSNIQRWIRAPVDCKTRLKCIDKNGVVDNTAYYMDGTPCDKRRVGTKVCWNNNCLSVKKNSVCKRNRI